VKKKKGSWEKKFPRTFLFSFPFPRTRPATPYPAGAYPAGYRRATAGRLRAGAASAGGMLTFNNNLPAAAATARSTWLRSASQSEGARLESIQAFFGEDQPYCEPRAATPAPLEPTSSSAPAMPARPFRLPVKQVT
jgi:hypothetical protein